MNYKKRNEVLLEVFGRVYNEHLNIRQLINTTMADICREENVSPYQVFSILLCFVFLVFYNGKPKLKMMRLITG